MGGEAQCCFLFRALDEPRLGSTSSFELGLVAQLCRSRLASFFPNLP
jgi:hypothetical protein